MQLPPVCHGIRIPCCYGEGPRGPGTSLAAGSTACRRILVYTTYSKYWRCLAQREYCRGARSQQLIARRLVKTFNVAKQKHLQSPP